MSKTITRKLIKKAVIKHGAASKRKIAQTLNVKYPDNDLNSLLNSMTRTKQLIKVQGLAWTSYAVKQ